VNVRGFRQFLNAPVSDEPLPASLYADYWHRMVRVAVMASILLSVILAAVLLFVEPPDQCPAGHVPDNQASPSIWLPFFMLTVPVLTALVFMVIRWKWLIQKAIASIDYPTTVPVPYVLVITILFGSGMAQFPWLLVVQCTGPN